MDIQYNVKKNGTDIGTEIIHISDEGSNQKLVIETNLVGYKSLVNILINKEDSRVLKYSKLIKGPFNNTFSLQWIEEDNVYLTNSKKYLFTNNILNSAEQIRYFMPSNIKLEKTDRVYSVYDFENERFWNYKLHIFNNSVCRIIYPESALCIFDNNGILEKLEIEHSKLSICSSKI